MPVGVSQDVHLLGEDYAPEVEQCSPDSDDWLSSLGATRAKDIILFAIERGSLTVICKILDDKILVSRMLNANMQTILDEAMQWRDYAWARETVEGIGCCLSKDHPFNKNLSKPFSEGGFLVMGCRR